MSRITAPKAKICRKFGVNLYGSPKYDKIMNKKPYGPGVHGPNARRRKGSAYGSQLKAKQFARYKYALSEKQFKKYVTKAINGPGDSGVNLLTLLESRADNVVFKSGLASSIFQARQMVNHGHFELNGGKIMTPSIHIKTEDILEVRENRKGRKLYTEISEAKPLKKESIPSWIQTDQKKLSIKVAALPQPQDFDPLVDTKSIIEFYSR
jgi:small subunit ribosomal protein S4